MEKHSLDMVAERSITADVSGEKWSRRNDRRVIHVLYVFPGEATGSTMIAARKQVSAMKKYHVCSDTFSLSSRTSLRIIQREARRFRDRLASFRPHVVHVQYGTMTAFFASLTTTVPLVITYRGSDLNPCPCDGIRSVGGRVLSQLAALSASGIICVSEQLKGRLWWGRERAIVLPSGVDTQIFSPRSLSKARQELGWEEGERIVLFNAGASPAVKRLDIAQAAVTEAEKLCGAIRFVVLNGHVPHAAVATMLNGADCLLVTSDWEGSPAIVQEALACDLPVVSVDVGDVRERLIGVAPSRIVERDPRAIGQGVAEIMASRARSNGHLVVDVASQDRVAQETVALYDKIVGLAHGSKSPVSMDAETIRNRVT